MDTTQTREINSSFGTLGVAVFLNTGALLKMFKSTFTPTPNSVVADFEANEVNFTGYSAVALASPFVGGVDILNQAIAIDGVLANFTQTGVVDTDIAGGYYITNALGTAIYGYGNFDVPINWDTNGNQAFIKPNAIAVLTLNADVEVITGP